MKTLFLHNPASFYYTRVYVLPGGEVRFKHTDGRKFRDLATFKIEYEEHFKKPAKFF